MLTTIETEVALNQSFLVFDVEISSPVVGEYWAIAVKMVRGKRERILNKYLDHLADKFDNYIWDDVVKTRNPYQGESC